MVGTHTYKVTKADGSVVYRTYNPSSGFAVDSSTNQTITPPSGLSGAESLLTNNPDVVNVTYNSPIKYTYGKETQTTTTTPQAQTTTSPQSTLIGASYSESSIGLTNPANMLKKNNIPSAQPLYLELNPLFKSGINPNVYNEKLQKTGDQVNKKVVSNIQMGLASVSGVKYYDKKTETKNGFDTTTETISGRGGVYTTTEKSINPEYKETFGSKTASFLGINKKAEPTLMKKSNLQMWSEKKGSQILSSQAYKSINVGFDKYTKKYIEKTPIKYSPIIPLYNKLQTGKASYNTKGAVEFSTEFRKGFQESILKDPVKSGIITMGGFAVGGALTQFKSGLGATGLKVFKGSEYVFAGATIGSVGYGTIKSENKAQFLGETTADFTLFGAGAYGGSKLAGKYSTVQARATKLPKELDLNIKEISTKEFKTIKEPRAIVNDEGTIIGINKEKPAMINTIKQDKIIGQNTILKGKDYLSDTITIGDTSSTTIKRRFGGKDFITKVTSKGGESTLQVFNKKFKPIGLKQSFSNGFSNIGVSEAVKVGKTKETLFLDKKTGERSIILSDTYKQDIISKNKDLNFKGKSIYTDIVRKEDFRLGRLNKGINKVSDILPKETLNLETEYIVTPKETFKEIKGRSFTKNKIILAKKSEYPADVLDITKEKYNPTVFRDTKVEISTTVNDRNIFNEKRLSLKDIKAENKIKFNEAENKGFSQLSESKVITQQVKMNNINLNKLIPKYNFNVLTTTPKISLKTKTLPIITSTSKTKIETQFKPISSYLSKNEVKIKQTPITTTTNRLSLSTSQTQLLKTNISTSSKLGSLSGFGESKYKSAFIPSPSPKIPTPMIPKLGGYMPSGGFGRGRGMSSKSLFKQQKGYTPTLFSATLKIKGKRYGKQSGLDVRPM